MRMIFVNLPVEDLPASRAFFTALGFEFNTEFSDASCACMVVDRNIFVMLLVRQRFGHFVVGRIADATAVTEVITCLSARAGRRSTTRWRGRSRAGASRGSRRSRTGRCTAAASRTSTARVGARAHGRDMRR
jgi:predicted lactoylglutathione lyase